MQKAKYTAEFKEEVVRQVIDREVAGYPSMRRRGKCCNNAVAESFFSNLKIEKIKKRIYKSRQAASSEVFEYIKGFYNPVRRHKNLDQLSPFEFERRQIV